MARLDRIARRGALIDRGVLRVRGPATAASIVELAPWVVAALRAR